MPDAALTSAPIGQIVWPPNEEDIKVDKSRLIRRYAALLLQLSSGRYECTVEFLDGGTDGPSAIIGTVSGLDQRAAEAADHLLSQDAAWTDVIAEAFMAGQMRQCQDLVASLDPAAWERAAGSINNAVRAGHRLVTENGATALQVCFDATVLARALNAELQASAG